MRFLSPVVLATHARGPTPWAHGRLLLVCIVQALMTCHLSCADTPMPPLSSTDVVNDTSMTAMRTSRSLQQNAACPIDLCACSFSLLVLLVRLCQDQRSVWSQSMFARRQVSDECMQLFDQAMLHAAACSMARSCAQLGQ